MPGKLSYWFLTLALAFTFALAGCLILEVAPASAQDGGQEYAVIPGDSLYRIAAKFYGDGRRWPAIVEATNARAAVDNRFQVVTNPSVLYTGQLLWIPTLGTGGPLPPEAPRPAARPAAPQRPAPTQNVVYTAPSGPCWAEPPIIRSGQSSTLRWNIPGALRVFAGAQQYTGPEGRVVVRPNATQTFRLLYSVPSGQGVEQFLFCDVTVRVN